MLDEAQEKKLSDRALHVARVALAYSICVIEVKVSEGDDPFERGPEDWTKGSQSSRVQIMEYVAEIFLRQHREFVYTVIITGKRARLMRWDRCGVIVTDAFDHTSDPGPLVNFFHFLATSSRAEQGCDTSMTLATKAQVDEVKAYKEELKDGGNHPYHVSFLENMLADDRLYPMYQVSVVLASSPTSIC